MTRLSHDEYVALAAFRHALRKLLRFSREYLISFDLTPEQYETLLALRAAPASTSIVVLSEQLQVKHHTAISLVNKLARRGLLRRQHRRADRRVVHLTRHQLQRFVVRHGLAAPSKIRSMPGRAIETAQFRLCARFRLFRVSGPLTKYTLPSAPPA